MLTLFQPDYLPFTAALGLLLALALLQLLGLDADLPDGGDGGLGAGLDWLNAGRLPALILGIFLLGLFAALGFAVQFVAAAVIGTLPWPLAAAAAGLLAVRLTRRWSGALARVLPLDETTAVDIDSLVGRPARIVLGVARAGHPARAEVLDAHGQRHFVMVEPVGSGELHPEQPLQLLARNGDIFRATTHPDMKVIP